MFWWKYDLVWQLSDGDYFFAIKVHSFALKYVFWLLWKYVYCKSECVVLDLCFVIPLLQLCTVSFDVLIETIVYLSPPQCYLRSRVSWIEIILYYLIQTILRIIFASPPPYMCSKTKYLVSSNWNRRWFPPLPLLASSFVLISFSHVWFDLEFFLDACMSDFHILYNFWF